MSGILVVATHPDDETLGCGGTLLRRKAEGEDIHWLIATAIGGHGASGRKARDRRGKEIRKVARMYGFKSVTELGFETTRLDRVPAGDLIGAVSAAVDRIKPDSVYLPFHGDVHSDHRVLFEAAFASTKVFRHRHVKKVYMMETLSETEFAPPLPHRAFQPNYFTDITGFLEGKIAVMKEFKGEMGEPPFPRSETGIRALAGLRGALAGCEHAEAFMLLRQTD